MFLGKRIKIHVLVRNLRSRRLWITQSNALCLWSCLWSTATATRQQPSTIPSRCRRGSNSTSLRDHLRLCWSRQIPKLEAQLDTNRADLTMSTLVQHSVTFSLQAQSQGRQLILEMMSGRATNRFFNNNHEYNQTAHMGYSAATVTAFSRRRRSWHSSSYCTESTQHTNCGSTTLTRKQIETLLQDRVNEVVSVLHSRL